MALEVETMRRTVRLAGDPRRSRFLVGANAERQQNEGAEGEEQEIDRDDRRIFHRRQPRRSRVTSTSGFLPVHKVAQRRTASRTASRTFSSSPTLYARVAASVASAKKSSRSSSTGTPNGRISGTPPSDPSFATGTATAINPPNPIRRRSLTV